MAFRTYLAAGLLSNLVWASPGPGTVAEGEWVDLTYDLSSASVFWPTAKPFKLKVDAKGVTDRGYYCSAYSFTTAEHGGTHIDAPVHFAEGRTSVDEIPLNRLIGPAVVVDVRPAAHRGLGAGTCPVAQLGYQASLAAMPQLCGSFKKSTR
jgi:hypothetical protein